MSELCTTCGEVTETHYRTTITGYVMHVCVECGADKRDDPYAPV